MNVTTEQVIYLLGQKQLEIEMLRSENQSMRQALSQMMPPAPDEGDAPDDVSPGDDGA